MRVIGANQTDLHLCLHWYLAEALHPDTTIAYVLREAETRAIGTRVLLWIGAAQISLAFMGNALATALIDWPGVGLRRPSSFASILAIRFIAYLEGPRATDWNSNRLCMTWGD